MMDSELIANLHSAISGPYVEHASRTNHPEVSLRGWTITLLLAFLIHASILLMARRIPAHESKRMQTIEIEFATLAAATAQSPREEPEPVAESPKDAAQAKVEVAPKQNNLRAQAANVVSAPSEARVGEDNTIVTGDADRFAGGVTSSDGTSTEAVAEAAPRAAEPLPRPPPAPRVDSAALTRSYLSRVREALAREKHYPIAAQKGGIEGTAVISFCILASGAFSNVSVVGSSGNELLDRAAVSSVNALSGRIPRPKEIGDLLLPLKTAIRFEIGK